MTYRRILHRTWCDVASLPVLRRWLRTNVPAGVDSADAELVCTELVANAIEHGGGARAVRITVGSGHVCFEVDDCEADALPTLGTSRLGRYRGRGIAVVDALAAWGTAGAARGKTVWARVKFAS
jgi:hypothetical protein